MKITNNEQLYENFLSNKLGSLRSLHLDAYHQMGMSLILQDAFNVVKPHLAAIIG
jgi:hypothetical protein